ncbi:MAG: tetratricopeptide repeat protein [Bryobacterales bacterium]|nr:tetratricopeptide repeat protein [Bryobacterales bacterium]
MAAGALILLLLAQAPDFEPLYRQALEQREKALGKDAEKTRESARDLGLYLAARGEYARAAAYWEPAMQLAGSLADATVLHNWAVAIAEDEPARAETMYRKVLALRKAGLAPMDGELAATRLNLAELMLARGDAGAGPLATAALVAFDRKLGPVNERSGAACGVVGAVLAMKGDVEGAERMFRRSLAIAEKTHGPGSARTASALENLADLLMQTGRESAARPLLARAERIRTGTR